MATKATTNTKTKAAKAESQDPYVKEKFLPVAQYLERMIEASGKSQLKISNEAGFEKPNIMTMMKQGKTRIPLAKIGKIAEALGVDPVHLYSMCMNEYEPENWALIKGFLKRPLITNNEMEIIELIRKANPDDPMVLGKRDELRISDLAKSLKSKKQIAQELATSDATDK